MSEAPWHSESRRSPRTARDVRYRLGRRSRGPIAGLRRSALFLLISLAVWAPLPGCRSETLLSRSGPEPAWRSWGHTERGGERYYVGVATAMNVLDEQAGRREARLDALEQVAESVESRVARRAFGRGPKDPPGVILPPQFSSSFRHELRGVKVKDWFHEKWLVNEGLFRDSFTRYKCFALAAYPDKEYKRLVDRLAAAVESDPEVLLVRVQAAISAGKLDEALKRAESAVFRRPQDSRSWWALYEVQKGREAWREAICALRQCAVLAVTPRERATVDVALNSARDSLARRLSARAAESRRSGSAQSALARLAEAWRVASDPELRASVESEYGRLLAGEVASRARQRAERDGLAKLALSNFKATGGGAAIRAAGLRMDVARELQSSPRPRIVTREIEPEQAQKILRGEWAGLKALRAELREAGIGGVILGFVGDRVNVLLGEPGAGETVALLAAPGLSSALVRQETAGWRRIRACIPSNAGASFSVKIWTDRRRYRVGEDVRIHLKADRDCYAYIFDVQTSGATRLIFPNRYYPDGAIQAGREYTLPESGLYAVKASGPEGWEGLRALATVRPLDTGAAPVGAFKRLDSEAREALLKRVGEQLPRLAPKDWAEGAWVFYIE